MSKDVGVLLTAASCYDRKFGEAKKFEFWRAVRIENTPRTGTATWKKLKAMGIKIIGMWCPYFDSKRPKQNTMGPATFCSFGSRIDFL